MKKENFVWILSCSMLVIFCWVLWHSNQDLKQDNQTQSTQIEKLQKQNTKLKRKSEVIDQKDNQNEFKQAQKQLQNLNASSTLVESNIYFSPEKVDNDNINGIFIGTVQTNSNESDNK